MKITRCRALLVGLALLIDVICADAQVAIFTTSAAPAGCAAATAYLAAQGGLNVTQSNAFNTAICALVTNGFFPGGATPLDGLYFMANASDANAKVNVISPGTHNLVEHGTCTFTANNGITGDGSTCYLDTGFIPSSAAGHFVQNSANLGFCLLNSRTTSTPVQFDAGSIGANSNRAYMGPVALTSQYGFAVNQGNTAAVGQALNTQALWIADRPASNLTTMYSASGGFHFDNAVASTGLSDASIYALALNNAGTPVDFAVDQMAVFFYGASFGPQVASNPPASIATFRTIMSASLD